MVMSNMYVVIRLRGPVGVRKEIEDTLKMLRLHKVNHCVLLEENDVVSGMIQKVKDYVAYGIIDKNSLLNLLKYRGRLIGNEKLTEQYLLDNTSYLTFEELSENLLNKTVKLKDLTFIKPVFRLHPPRKGHRGIKRTVQQGGSLGNHGTKISNLLYKMR